MAERKTGGPNRLSSSQEVNLLISSDPEALAKAFWTLELARTAWKVHGARLRAAMHDGRIESDDVFAQKGEEEGAP